MRDRNSARRWFDHLWWPVVWQISYSYTVATAEVRSDEDLDFEEQTIDPSLMKIMGAISALRPPRQ
jgi:hypothetical protein